jgi:hypothetical protein
MKMSRQRLSSIQSLFLIGISFLFGATGHARDSDQDYAWLKSCDVDCILISLADQRMDVFGDHQLIAWSTISSGRIGFSTPTGIFVVTEKDRDHHSNLYHNAPMPFFLRLTDGGVGMHAGVLPGYPASHGCIRLPEVMAHELYLHVEPGAFVQVIDGPISSILTPEHKSSSTVAKN